MAPFLLNYASSLRLFCRAFTDVCHVLLFGGRDVLPIPLLVPRNHLSSAASGDSSSSRPPAKRSRFASQPITERETTPATVSNSSAPANNDENGINDQESGPCSSPSQPQPNSAVAAASPNSAGVGEVPASLGVAAPTKPARSRESSGSRTVLGEVQDEVSCNLGVAEGWVVDSSSSSKSPPVKVEPPITG